MAAGYTSTLLNLSEVHDARTLFHEMALQKAIPSARIVDKPLILYGAGDLGRMAKAFFDKLGIPFLYVVDANPDRCVGDAAWKGVSIVKPEDVSEEHRANCLLAICVVTHSYSSVSDPLTKQGWRDVVPFYDVSEAYADRHPLGNGWFTGDLKHVDVEGVEYVLDQWNDDISKAHHLQFIAWHSLRKEMVFDGAPVTTGNRFFIPEVISSFGEEEVFLDGGAHHGDVSLRFMNIVRHKFAKLYAIEPDKENVKVLRNRLCPEDELSTDKIEILECALGNQSGSAPFLHGFNYASRFSPMAQETVDVRTIDDMNIPISILKLHLEGSELEALQGAAGVLKRYRPIVAATTYHNRKGLWLTPEFLMKRLNDYVFLLRLHSWMGTGCVLYAIPRERYDC